MITTLQITPLEHSSGIGARVTLPSYTSDPSKLNEKDFTTLSEALHRHLVVVIPGQKNLQPSSQYHLTARFDPSVTIDGATSANYGHGKEFRHEKSVLKKDGKSVPHQPQVQILGQGSFENHEGLESVDLTHPVHSSFHKDVLSEERVAAGETRFYRWHIDSALYGLSPPLCTTLLGIHVPKHTTKQRILYEDTGEELEVVQGATAFASGATAFKLLSSEDQKLALGTTVIYAPHPYIFISPASATSDGLTMVSEDKECSMEELPPWEESKVKKLPLVWTNLVTGEHHLQAHGCCVWKLQRDDGTVLELLAAREELHRLMRPAISPSKIYTHAWEEGDLAIFFNRGVWHSVTGQFSEGERRLMHQCNIASGSDPSCLKI
ncbi:hypothetical protein BABINDRAFT_166790 [Babjeviella inositovora NRRL Y-12698]|uniref:TauD/TfdA-like domain-containing protein n=1 Tax=Babjeviella inositovora NRRL Y-12698 TaxID=984486 RepID=A0A1E3QPT3_9ASCO|nr:uncharacterized protein BABINDRAFT_166790 [Babjeviella inositovora NRRL Y-12698]ODQ79671.1 hypothetical protein BABINDRAFT_166790 [Babjeviella inositovora NRRL Y-12698]